MQFEQQDYRHAYGVDTGHLLPLHVMTRAAPINCFAPDAPVATLTGERAMDSLVPGQMVLTNSGPRTPRISTAAAPADAMFCHVPAGAFGPNVPLHDLWLSPDQPIALRLDQTMPSRTPVAHSLSCLMARFGRDAALPPRQAPMPQTAIQLEFAQPAVIYIAGLPIHIAAPEI
jgi:hypothetical protein